MELGKVLLLLRNQHNYSQEYVANHINRDYTTYGRYEKGTVSPPIDKLLMIADLYGMTVQELIDYEIGDGKKQMISVVNESEPVYGKKGNLSLNIILDGKQKTLDNYMALLKGVNEVLNRN